MTSFPSMVARFVEIEAARQPVIVLMSINVVSVLCFLVKEFSY